MSSTRTPWQTARVDERHRSFGASARRRVDELEALDLEAQQRLGEVRDLEADVVEPLPLRGEESGDAGRVVGRLDELDLRLADPEKRDPHPVGRHVDDRLRLEPQRVVPEPERTVDRADDERHVMDLAELPDPRRNGPDGARGRHRTLPVGRSRALGWSRALKGVVP